ncbi:F-box only protein 6-like isoform X2 [Ornithodoros turicata]
MNHLSLWGMKKVVPWFWNNKLEPMEPFPINDLPETVVEHILAFVSPNDLIQNCRLTCKWFRNIVDSNGFWKAKCEREKRTVPNFRFEELPPRLYQLICIYDPYGSNLLKNSHGDLKSTSSARVVGFPHWEIVANGGNGWTVECPPAGADALPLENQHCFATSYDTCRKQQVIELAKAGVLPEVLDKLCPSIEVSEWYAARFDCGSIYELYVDLLNAEGTPIASFNTGVIETQQWVGREWNQVKYTFRHYPAGVRFLKFVHSGRDTQFWAGHYGSKMAGGAVRIIFE